MCWILGLRLYPPPVAAAHCRVVSAELDKLAGLEPVSPEFNVTRTYLEWLTCLPWGLYSKEIFDIKHAQEVCARGVCCHHAMWASAAMCSHIAAVEYPALHNRPCPL